MSHVTATAVRNNTVRALAERAASHPQIEAAVMGAIRGVLPTVLEQLIAEQAETQGSHVLRLYGRRSPSEQRRLRDERVRAMLEAGAAPEVAAVNAGCSRTHAYKLQRALRTSTKLVP